MSYRNTFSMSKLLFQHFFHPIIMMKDEEEKRSLIGDVHVVSRLVTGRRKLRVLCGVVCLLAALREGKCLHYSLNEQVHIHRLPYQNIFLLSFNNTYPISEVIQIYYLTFSTSEMHFWVDAIKHSFNLNQGSSFKFPM